MAPYAKHAAFVLSASLILSTAAMSASALSSEFEVDVELERRGQHVILSNSSNETVLTAAADSRTTVEDGDGPGGYWSDVLLGDQTYEVVAARPSLTSDNETLDLIAGWNGDEATVSWQADQRFAPFTVYIDGEVTASTYEDSWSDNRGGLDGATVAVLGTDKRAQEAARDGHVGSEGHPETIEVFASVRLGEPMLTESSRADIGTASDPSLVFRHQTFINEQGIMVPWPGTGSRCFNGNNRGFSPTSNQYKSRVDVRTTWHTSSSTVTYGSDVPNGRLHDNCTPVSGPGLMAEAAIPGELIESRTTSANISVVRDSGGSNSGRSQYSVGHSAVIPFSPLGTGLVPAIDYNYDELILRMGLITIQGVHDMAPSHEIYVSGLVPQPLWWPVYQFRNEGFTNLLPTHGNRAINISL